ncbi:hypothetical protein ASF30_14045 [Leifsonia sp. Leaf264]|nr:hypothetical protein ASF30_14045 [Leifsonia sp. Leaf264]
MEDREIAGQIGATLRELGVESAGFRARQLTRSMLEKADLILTAERSHRALVVRMHPKALSRTFTIAQAGRMLKFVPTGPVLSSPLDRIAGLTHSLAAARGLAGPSSDHDDIADPWGESDAAYRRATSSIAPVVTQLASSLIPSRHSAR